MNHSRSQMRAAKREKHKRGHRSTFPRDFLFGVYLKLALLEFFSFERIF
jgi:hypothetical protein